MKILMVCLGNICRSPLAEGILKSKLNSKFSIDSAGTLDFHQGNKPDKRSISVALRHDVDISQQKSRPIQSDDFEIFDKIYCMDKNNVEDVLKLAKTAEQKAKISLILENDQEVPDPYYGNEEDFENVYQMLDIACDRIAIELLK
ncbi:low molecular weight protein-tyrosine-phosphatase [Frigoriflavimonas asaccharolytica]|uniref:protein-tyrosine-phosphatase n=1 Tax=Frigoriflavimonas asaccharolytica TaxID=2735899 RepID=A0A8J8G5I3_9FLAO|nr:low molecular weight protein-tyrosine-phosphatase [Frigoriflavimonas asaccharolytica]NRS91843.1 protein-tyrosine phosphatase [Frigoriflavimonas asaccharolytica]